MVCLLSLLGKQDELFLTNCENCLQQEKSILSGMIILSILGNQEDLVAMFTQQVWKKVTLKNDILV